MSEEKKPTTSIDDDRFDLEIEATPDTDEIMREAVASVRSIRSRGKKPSGSKSEDVSGVSEADLGEADDEGTYELKIQLQEAQERSVRALADYENFRRRVERERADFSRYAAERALAEFLPVLDNLTRALEAGGSFDDLKGGVELIHKQMEELLGRFHVAPVPSVGERFDPSVHEAVARAEDEQFEQPTVLEEYQTGYTLHDRLLRPSMVRVAVPVDQSSATADQAEELSDDSEESTKDDEEADVDTEQTD